MKKLLLYCISLFLCFSCQESSYLSSTTSDVATIEKDTTYGKSPSIFQELRDQVNEIDRDQGLQGPFKQLKSDDGTNAFDQVMREIAKEDADSGGQVSDMIDFMISAAEKEMGIENMGELIGENLEKMNEFAGTSEQQIKDLLGKASDAGYTPDKIEDLLSGIQDFIQTGGENGGMEKILELIVDQDARQNPNGSASDPIIDKMKEIISNDELSAEKELESLMRELLEKNQYRMTQAMNEIN